MPFEVFQDCFEEVFKNINGEDIYITDIRIRVKNLKEHNEKLNMVLERARERMIKFKLEKCKSAANKLKFMGYIFTENGVEIDPDKVKSIVEMKPPQNKSELETFLGMITCVSKFVSNVAEKTVILRNLTKKDVT